MRIQEVLKYALDDRNVKYLADERTGHSKATSGQDGSI